METATGRQKAAFQPEVGLGQLFGLCGIEEGITGKGVTADLGNGPTSVSRVVHLLVFTQSLGSG